MQSNRDNFRYHAGTRFLVTTHVTSRHISPPFKLYYCDHTWRYIYKTATHISVTQKHSQLPTPKNYVWAAVMTLSNSQLYSTSSDINATNAVAWRNELIAHRIRSEETTWPMYIITIIIMQPKYLTRYLQYNYTNFHIDTSTIFIYILTKEFTFVTIIKLIINTAQTRTHCILKGNMKCICNRYIV